MQTENDESVESFCLQESVWRWSYTQSLCSSCTSRRAPSMPESFHSSPHMWRALVFNTINHRGGFGNWEGGLYSLDWTFDSAFWLVLRLVTMYSDDWIQKLCCEAGAWLQLRFMPQPIFFPLSSSYNNLWAFVQPFPLNYTCQTGVSPTAVRTAKRHTWAGSFAYWWARDGWLGVIELEWNWNRYKYIHNNQENLLALKKHYRFSAKYLVKSTFHFNCHGGLIHSNSAD